jgi:hypothetical protein
MEIFVHNARLFFTMDTVEGQKKTKAKNWIWWRYKN